MDSWRAGVTQSRGERRESKGEDRELYERADRRSGVGRQREKRAELGGGERVQIKVAVRHRLETEIKLQRSLTEPR